MNLVIFFLCFAAHPVDGVWPFTQLRGRRSTPAPEGEDLVEREDDSTAPEPEEKKADNFLAQKTGLEKHVGVWNQFLWNQRLGHLSR